MIKKISELKDIGIFRELRSSRGMDGDFGKFNVLYAENGCGKSTICDVLRAIGTGDFRYIIGRSRIGGTQAPCLAIELHDEHMVKYANNEWLFDSLARPSILVYDDRFVSDNVFVGHQVDIRQKRNLYGLVLGQRARELQNAVAVAEDELTDATQNLNSAHATLTSIIPRGYTIDAFKALEFVENVDELLAQAKQELESKEALKHNVAMIQARPFLKKYPALSMPSNFLQILSKTLDEIALVAEQKIQQHLCEHTNNLSIAWLQRGVEAREGESCPFCGQDMSGSELFRTYTVYFSGELKSLNADLQNLSAQFDSLLGATAQTLFKDCVTQLQADKTWWHDVAQLDLDIPILDVEAVTRLFEEVLTTLHAILARKRENIAKATTTSDDENGEIARLEDAIAMFKSANDKIDAVNSLLVNYKRDVVSQDISQIQEKIDRLSATKKRYEADAVDAITTYENAVQKRNEAASRKSEANANLKEQSESIFNMYGAKINEILQRFGVPFKIVPEGVSFRGGPPAGQLGIELNRHKIDCSDRSTSDPQLQSLSNTLSGGDKSALALAFFIAIAEGLDDLQNTIIAFDDPYHDQDANRRNFTINYIHDIARRCEQCFVFSHNLEFAYDVERCKGIESRRSFIIPRYDNPVELRFVKLPQLPSLRYVLDYKELVMFSQHPTGDEEHLKLIAALIREVLENYIRHKYPSSWDANSWLGTMVGKIRNASGSDPLCGMRSALLDLTALESYCSRYHHGPEERATDTPQIGELKTHVDIALKVLHST